MNTVLKASCLAIQLLAIVGSLGAVPHAITSAMQVVAVLLLAGHVLELHVAEACVS